MNLRYRKGSLADSERFIQFLDEVKSAMVHQDWFYLDPPDIVREMLSEGILEFWLAMDADRPAAVFSILYPGLRADNYGYDLALREEELLRVIHMDTAAVHPNYRGLGLQKKMMHLVEEELYQKGSRILLSTVHPENTYSLNNMLSLGYKIQKRVKKYGSERYILRKNIF